MLKGVNGTPLEKSKYWDVELVLKESKSCLHSRIWLKLEKKESRSLNTWAERNIFMVVHLVYVCSFTHVHMQADNKPQSNKPYKYFVILPHIRVLDTQYCRVFRNLNYSRNLIILKSISDYFRVMRQFFFLQYSVLTISVSATTVLREIPGKSGKRITVSSRTKKCNSAWNVD